MAVKPIHPRDPDDPNYPHGTSTGRNLGCRSKSPCPSTPSCHTVWDRKRKQADLRRAGLKPRVDSDNTPIGPVLAHLGELLRIPNATHVAVAEAAGLPSGTVTTIVNRPWQKYVRIGTARKLLQTTPAMVRALVGPSPRKVTQLIRSMQVQGWPITWQAQQIGVGAPHLKAIVAGENRFSSDLGKKIEKLAGSVEGKTGPARSSATKARKGGWQPLAAYDDEGNLLRDAVRNERRDAISARQAARAQQIVEIMRHSFFYGYAASKTAEILNVHPRDVQRVRTATGVMFIRDQQDDITCVAPGYEERAEKVRELLRAQRDLGIDALDFVQEHFGLLSGGKTAGGPSGQGDQEQETPTALIPAPAAGDRSGQEELEIAA